jgi:predicted MPP superfamily phosphohydrolase
MVLLNVVNLLMKKIILILILIVFLCIGYDSFFIEPNKISVTTYTIADDELKGIKIVFPSDFHIRPYQHKKLKKIVEIINKENPDLVLSVGDFVSLNTTKYVKPFSS